MYNFNPITIDDVASALNNLKTIERPYGDNEGSAINSPSVYDYLSVDEQQLIDNSVQIVRDYICNTGSEPNRRAIAVLNHRGYCTYFNQDQYDPYRFVGSVSVGDWLVDISDPTVQTNFY